MALDSQKLKVLVLNASLKHEPDVSNTEEVVGQVLGHMGADAIESEMVRLADKNIPVGLSFKESEDDEWPAISEKIIAADIVIFATPIWWGQRSSLMQRIIERMDAFDEDVHNGGRAVLLNKVAGIVITGSEDGAQHVGASIMEVLTFMNFTLPPQCIAYWVGEVGLDPKTDRERRQKNPAVDAMAKNLAQGLVYYAELLKKNPMQPM
jgi:multimeric flavodoxin WrbA